MTYNELVAILTNLYGGVLSTTPAFATELPDTIAYANNRCCRDLDFLQTRMALTGPALTPGSRNVSMAALTDTVIVLEQVNIITPVSTAPDAGRRWPLTRYGKTWMDLMYPISGTVPAAVTIPTDFAMVDEDTIIVGPVSDAAYGTEFFGTIRPAPISATNSTTWLTDNLPDLFVAACMVRLSGLAKNYGNTQADDPQQPVSWETQYGTLLKGAAVEEARRKAQSASWSDQKALPESTPARA